MKPIGIAIIIGLVVGVIIHFGTKKWNKK